jgi:hypothetical protein
MRTKFERTGRCNGAAGGQMSRKRPYTIGTAFGTTFDNCSPRNPLFLLDSFESSTSSSGHHLLTHILMKSKKTLTISVLWGHFRDRFQDHFVRFGLWSVRFGGSFSVASGDSAAEITQHGSDNAPQPTQIHVPQDQWLFPL